MKRKDGRGRVARWLHLGLAVVLGLVACQSPSEFRPAPTPPPTPAVTPLLVGLSSAVAHWPDLVTYSGSPVMLYYSVNNVDALLADLRAGALDAVLTPHLPPAGLSGPPLWFNPVALDGLALILHPDNPVRNLTLPQAQAIFAGQLTNWQSLGGPNLPITPVSREPEAETRALLAVRLLGEQRLTLNAVIQTTAEAVLAYVAAHPEAIGYTMLGALPPAGADARPVVQVIALDGILPTPTTTADQSYPLTTPLYFVALQEPQGELRAWLAWLQSPAGQAQLGVRYGRVR